MIRSCYICQKMFKSEETQIEHLDENYEIVLAHEGCARRKSEEYREKHKGDESLMFKNWKK